MYKPYYTLRAERFPLHGHLRFGPLTWLIACGLGTVLCTIAAAAFMYIATQRMISAAEWVEHTHEVLGELQNASADLKDIEFNSRLYAISADKAQLAAARSAAKSLQDEAAHIGSLVSDNSHQNGNVANLLATSSALNQALNGLGKVAEPRDQLMQGQQTIQLMVEQEKQLLKERTRRATNNTSSSQAAEFAFAALSLVILVTLLGIVLRDAELRGQAARQMTQTNDALASSVKALENQAFEADLLASLRDDLQLCANLEEVYRSAANTAARLLPLSSGSLAMINSSRNLMQVVSSWGGSAASDHYPPESCWGIRSGEVRWHLPGAVGPHCAHFDGEAPEAYFCMPVSAGGNTLGLLHARFDRAEDVTTARLRMAGVRQLLQLIGMSVTALNLRIKLENESIRDSLTGLFNRHFMEVALERELARAVRRNTQLAVFMLDVDHFKSFNDSHGHAAGDDVLRRIAEILQASVRNEDIVCRYGGEEFTIIVPEITPAIALQRAEGVRVAVADLQLALGNGVSANATISLGVALYPGDGRSPASLLRMADEALYRAKREGRNQVSLAEMRS